MNAAIKKDKVLVNKVINLVESGYNPEQICQEIIESEEQKVQSNAFEDKDVDESFSNEILIISQAMAFRYTVDNDIEAVINLLEKSYRDEVNGEESFRLHPIVDRELIKKQVQTSEYNWCLAECPNGRGIIEDGSIIGVCCYSTDGTSRKNGEVIGKLGSIRYFGILPQLRGYCIGQRLLDKVENLMTTKHHCCQVMSCLPSTRVSLHEWIERRGYIKVKEIDYPHEALSQKISKPVNLIVYLKSFDSDKKVNMSLPPLWRSVKNRNDVYIPEID